MWERGNISLTWIVPFQPSTGATRFYTCPSKQKCVLKECCAPLTVLFQAENTYKTPECKWLHPPPSSTSVLCSPPLSTALTCCLSSVTRLWLQVSPLSAMMGSLLKPLVVPTVWTCHKRAAAATTCYNGRFLLTKLICFNLLGSSAFDSKWTSSVLETCLTLWGQWTENRPF